MGKNCSAANQSYTSANSSSMVAHWWLRVIRLYEDHMDAKAPGKEFKRQAAKGKWER